MRTVTRREYLQLGSATAGLATVGSLAGCRRFPFAAPDAIRSALHGRSVTINALEFGIRPREVKSIGRKRWTVSGIDNAPLIQNAIDSLPPYDEQTGTGGGVVYIPTGTWHIKHTITLPPGVVLRGDGFHMGTNLAVPPGTWTDKNDPHPMIDVRHPESVHRTAPHVGLDRLDIDAFDRLFMHDKRKVYEDRAFAEAVYNPGAIPVVWRGGAGSFMRNCKIKGTDHRNRFEDLAVEHAFWVPPECHAGPSLIEGCTFGTQRLPILLENAHNIVFFEPSYSGTENGSPYVTMRDCTGIIFHPTASEGNCYMRAERSQAAIYGGFSGWGSYHRGGKDKPRFDLVDSDMSIYGFSVSNVDLVLRETRNGETFELKGTGGEHGKGKGSVEHQAFLAFHPGANAIIPQDGKGRPRVF